MVWSSEKSHVLRFEKYLLPLKTHLAFSWGFQRNTNTAEEKDRWNDLVQDRAGGISSNIQSK